MSQFRKRKGGGGLGSTTRQVGPLPLDKREECKNEFIKIYLVGNPNVGKSVIFNKLTGMNVIVSNYPGTTVEVAEGVTEVNGHKVLFKDLPGIYSLGASSKDQEVTVKAIFEEKPDVIINVVNAINLERNLNLTLQLLELNVPGVIALNQVDFAARRGIHIDAEKLEEILGVPVIPTIAIHGKNIRKLLETALLEASVEHKSEHHCHHHGLHHMHDHLHDEHHLCEGGKPLCLVNEMSIINQENISPEKGFRKFLGIIGRKKKNKRGNIVEKEMSGEGERNS
ncbi:MAG: FeoB small GTPase domain-containing protein [Candidatus Jordarchaeaceae archaeon]